MPQLPSGRHVGLSADHLLNLAKQGDLQLTLAVKSGIKTPEDLKPGVNIVYFEPAKDGNGPGEPYPAGLLLSDIYSGNCDWPQEDIAAFRQSVESERGQAWLKSTFDELMHLIETVPPEIPENLKGILDSD